MSDSESEIEREAAEFRLVVVDLIQAFSPGGNGSGSQAGVGWLLNSDNVCNAWKHDQEGPF